jgi:hypothetical protein
LKSAPIFFLSIFFLDTLECKCSVVRRRLIGFPNVIQGNQLWPNYTVR